MSNWNADTTTHPPTGGERPGSLGSGWNCGDVGAAAPPSGGLIALFNPTISYSLGCVNNGAGGAAGPGQGQIFPTGRS
jgi:hypothetical protein